MSSPAPVVSARTEDVVGGVGRLDGRFFRPNVNER